MAYEDTKHRKDKRVPVYLSEYGYEKLERIAEALGGQKSAVGREAMERGIDQLLHEIESACHGPIQMDTSIRRPQPEDQ